MIRIDFDVDKWRFLSYDEIGEKIMETAERIESKPFEKDLIAEYGTDPGMTVEPSMTEGYPAHIESVLYDGAFTKGAYTMEKVGDVSAPIVSSFGVHILEYTRDIPEGAVEMTEAIRSALKAELLAAAESTLFNAKMDELMAAAQVEYTEAAAPYRPTEAAAQ